MSKKILMLAAKANMIQQFNHRNIKILQELGFEVHVATNMVDFGSMSTNENERFKEWMAQNNVIPHQVDFERRMGTLKGNLRSIKQLRNVFKDNHFTFIHVHSPLGSILGRLVAKQFKIPTIYTAHGFHFFKGGPMSSWLFFYPLEWLFSFITDTLITINDEDYTLAKKHMHAKKIVKINGIGIDINKSWSVTKEEKKIAREKIRKELGIPEESILISSIGELSARKNHKVVIEALKGMPPKVRNKFYYVIAGTGNNADFLRELVQSFKFEDHFKLLGYRTDIHEINYSSDVSVFPSYQEGLGIAGLEATVDGTFLIGANIRGISDYIKSNVNGMLFSPNSSSELRRILEYEAKHVFERSNNSGQYYFLTNFDEVIIDKTMKKIYKQLIYKKDSNEK